MRLDSPITHVTTRMSRINVRLRNVLCRLLNQNLSD
jgi:hypothetical protein